MVRAKQSELRSLPEPIGQRLRQVNRQVTGHVAAADMDANPAAHVYLVNLEFARAIAVRLVPHGSPFATSSAAFSARQCTRAVNPGKELRAKIASHGGAGTVIGIHDSRRKSPATDRPAA
jgi:hypothetical protein